MSLSSSPTTPTQSCFIRPLSLPPSSPFINPFDSPTSILAWWKDECLDDLDLDLDSPSSIRTTVATSDVRTAYVAARSAADLIRLLDLDQYQSTHWTQDEGRQELEIKEGGDGLVEVTRRREGGNKQPSPSLDIAHSNTLPPPANLAFTMSPLSAFNSSPAKTSLSTHTTSPSSTLPPTSPPSSNIAFPRSGPAHHRLQLQSPGYYSPPPRGRHDTSFLTFSQASSVVSDTVSMASSDRTSVRRPNVPVDKSFLRMTTTTGVSSDWGPSSHTDKPPSGTSDADDEHRTIEMNRASAVSTGMFGRPRRWSTIGSVKGSSSNRDTIDPFANAREAGESFLSDEEEADTPSLSSGARRRRRHASLSSSSTSGYLGPIAGPVLQAQHANGIFPIPTRKRTSLNQPKSDAAITSHLLKSASLNERRVNPSSGDKPTLAPAITLAPPSLGTPLIGGVREERGVEDSSDGDVAMMAKKRAQRQGRTMSKVDQVLGQGAQIASEIWETERRTLKDAIEKSVVPKTPSGPVPPPRGQHKPSASVPMVFPSPPPRLGESPITSPQHGRSESLSSPPRQRSGSIDSIPSLRPSIADSYTHLIPSQTHSPNPQQYDKNLPPVPSPDPRAALRDETNLDVASRNDLSPEQRQMRALENRLGEPLRESETGKWVVEPSQGISNIATNAIDNARPASVGSKSRVPERATEDCLPRTVPANQVNTGIVGVGLQRSGSMQRNGSKIAQNFRAALRLDKKDKIGDELEVDDSDVKVSVGRDLRISETSFKPLAPVTITGGLISPLDTDFWPESSVEDEVTRRNRRRQLAKLERILGPVVSPIQLSRLAEQAQPTTRQASSRPTSAAAKRSSSPAESDQVSFITFDDSPVSRKSSNQNSTRKEPAQGSWASRIRQTLKSKNGKGGEVKMSDDQSFMDLRKEAVWGRVPNSPASIKSTKMRDAVGTTAQGDYQKELSDLEKAQARKRAQKLGQVFGDPPPQDMYHPTAIRAQAGTHSPLVAMIPDTRGTTRPTFETYNKQLQGLIYLVDRKPSQLAHSVDELEAGDQTVQRGHARGTPSSPTSPMHPTRDENLKIHDKQENYENHENLDETSPTPSPDLSYPIAQSHSARRKRTNKLSHFFGETNINFDQPHHTPPGALLENRNACRDERRWMGLWENCGRGVQMEVKKGSMKLDEMDKLGDLFSALRRKRDGLGGWEEL